MTMLNPDEIKNHARRELQHLGYKLDGTEEGANGAILRDILALTDAFADQAHSLESASYLIHAFAVLASRLPLSPLTGSDDEWAALPGGGWQNIRHPAVLKDDDGEVRHVRGLVFVDPVTGEEWQDDGCDMPVLVFPFTPAIVRVERPVPPRSDLEAGATHRPIVIADSSGRVQ